MTTATTGSRTAAGGDSPLTNSHRFEDAGVDPHVLQAVMQLAADLAENGREGKQIGAMFVIGDEEEVMRRSYPLILDPLAGHSDEVKSILEREMQGTVRELALLDGAFIISSDGVVLSAARCLDVSTRDVEVPMGLGSRHRAAASLTHATNAIAVVVSQSSAVRLFFRGRIVDELFEPRQRKTGVATSRAAQVHTLRKPRVPAPMRFSPDFSGASRRRPRVPGDSPPMPVNAPPRKSRTHGSRIVAL